MHFTIWIWKLSNQEMELFVISKTLKNFLLCAWILIKKCQTLTNEDFQNFWASVSQNTMVSSQTRPDIAKLVLI